VRPKEVARAVELACILEVTAPKPGNVNRQHDFDDTTYEDFILSAWASAPVFSRSEELSVGQLILEGGAGCAAYGFLQYKSRHFVTAGTVGQSSTDKLRCVVTPK